MKSLLLPHLGSLLLVTLAPLHGATVFSQLPSSSSGDRVSSTLNYFGNPPGYRTYEDFTLGSDAAVTGLTWWGAPRSGGTDFSVTFYAGGATPGAQLASFTLSPTIQPAPAPPADLLFYSASLNAPFNAVGGTQYWVSIFNGAADASWAWKMTTVGAALQEELGGNGFLATPSGLAFTLESDSVVIPEPASGLMAGLGMMLCVGRRSRNRKA